MVRRDGAETKKERLQSMARSIQAALFKEGELSLSKTLALYEYEYGLTPEKVKSYLILLEKLGHFVIDWDNDKIMKV
jgi:hypothetical protein